MNRIGKGTTERIEVILDGFFSLGAPLGNIVIRDTHDLTVPVSWSIHRRTLDAWLCTLITGGKGILHVQGESFPLAESSFYLIGPGMEHSIGTDRHNPIRLKSVHFRFEGIAGEPLFLIRNLNLSYYQQFDGLMGSCLSSHTFSGNPYQSFLARNSLFQVFLLFRDFLEEQPRQTHDLSTIISSLDSGRDYSIRELADMAGYSEKGFIRKFRKLFGTTPHHYLVMRKMARGKFLLTNSSLSVKEISAALNYSDQYVFSRQFKRYTGFTPTGFRDSRASD